MNNDAHVRNLQSQYGQESTNLVIPLSDKASRFLAQLNEFVPMPLPELIEAMLENAISHECWPEDIDWGWLMSLSPVLDSPEEQVSDLLSGGSLH
jgi:hypothetical protein